MRPDGVSFETPTDPHDTVSLERKPTALWQRDAWTHGQESAQQHADGHGQRSARPHSSMREGGNSEAGKAGTRRHTETHTRRRAHPLPTEAHLPGLRMRSPTRHGVLVTSKGRWGDVKMSTGIHRVYIDTQQRPGWEHTWAAQSSPQKDLFPVADSMGNLS